MIIRKESQHHSSTGPEQSAPWCSTKKKQLKRIAQRDRDSIGTEIQESP
jgi:hypothetical protein